MPLFGDESGLFWNENLFDTRRGQHYDRPLPPIPETGWELPTEFPDLSGQGAIAIDTETNDPQLRSRGPGFVRGDAKVVGVAVGTEAGFRKYYPVGHEIGPNLPREQVFNWLRPQLATSVPKVGANIRYDVEALASEGIKISGDLYDVQNAEPLLDENKLTYSLDSLAREHLGETKVSDVIDKWLAAAFGRKHIKENIWRAPSAIAGPYAEGDVDLPLRIFAKQRKLLEADKLWDVFMLETRLIPLLNAMRWRGVRVDVDRADELRATLATRQAELLAEIGRQSGVTPELWANDSLAKVFDAVGVPYPRTEKKNAPSFQKEWLTHHPHPIAKLIKEARELDKLRSTFVESYILNGHVNGKIHCMFNQLRSDDAGTVSGRFSSQYPNLQNIPVRSDEGKLLRTMFIPEEGQLWWKRDWSQIEYRLIAHYAARLKLRGASEVVDRYRNDPDVDYHQAIADMTGLPRASAKNLNFGLAYGQGIDLLCYNLGVDRAEGERIIKEYHRRAPFVRPLMNRCSRHVEAEGRIRTFGGRLRHFDVWEKEVRDEKTGKTITKFYDHPEPGTRRAFMHKTLNGLIQGSAADIMKLAMVRGWEAGVFEPDALGAPHLTVHDELDGSLDSGNKRHVEALREVDHIMEHCVELLVPLRADGSEGANWGSLK